MQKFYQDISYLKRFRAPALILGAIALWVGLPFYLGADSTFSRAESFNPGITAILSGSPVGGVTPRGSAVFQSFTANGSTTKSLNVQVSSVNFAANTALQVSLNSASIGQITLNSNRSGVLDLHGSTVPTVVTGDTLTVTNGTTTVLSGTFVAAATPSPSPTHSPSPSPSHTPNPSPTGSPTPHPSPSPITRTHYFAPLTGDAIDGVMPRGIGEYEVVGTHTEFETYINFVNLADSTVLTVAVDGTSVGTITLNHHQGGIRLSSDHGDTVPAIAVGAVVTVKNGSATVLSGTFTDMPPTPSGTPTPHPSPTGSPTPHPTPTGTPMPHVIRAFSSQLRGASVVPPVTTDARGAGFIRLNTAETEITVNLRYFGLSGAATAVTINGPALPTENGAVVFTLTNSGGTTGQAEQQTFDVTAEQVQQLRAGLLYFVVSTANNTAGEIRGQVRPIGHRGDFDGDGASEIAVLRQNGTSDSTWYILNSLDNSLTAQTLGRTGDINVQGDYDGDGVTDAAVFTPSNGNWQINRSATGETVNYRFGQAGDIPMLGDYDGDGRSDIAVFRPSTGSWYISRSTDNNFYGVQFGQNGDKPIAGDFDGDGINDFAVFRPSTGSWYVLNSSTGTMFGMQWGASTDRPVTGDFDGDGRSDVAVFRPSNGTWYIYRSSDRTLDARQFGQNGDIPIACEYDGDNRTDIAVFRPSNGYWYILRSSDNGLSAYQFGFGTDIPLQTVYAP